MKKPKIFRTVLKDELIGIEIDVELVYHNNSWSIRHILPIIEPEDLDDFEDITNPEDWNEKIFN